MANSWDLVVIGGTPGGIAAAIAAARQGRTVALVERQSHIGGMSTSGLGKSDIEHPEAIGGLFLEFIARIRETYVASLGAESEAFALCREGYYFEPSVAEAAFLEMLAELPTIELLLDHQLEGAAVQQNRVTAVELQNRITGERILASASAFVDATYEGDLLAAAGAEFRLGRESREEYGESHAGEIFFDYRNGEILPGSTGQGDDRLPAYTYRLCLSSDPGNSAPLTQPPAGYDRTNYLGYLDDLESGRLSAPKVLKDGWGYYPEHFDTLVRALSVTDLPNGKVDANINPRPLAFPFAEENVGYIEANWRRRDEIADRHRQLTLGLLWFLQQDDAVPAEHREMAGKYHLPADEFTDNGNFPWQLYVREGRRLVGLATLTEHDVTFTGDAPAAGDYEDTIAVGEFPIDSFPVQKRPSDCGVVLEGYLGMLAHITRPYPIPYRVMIPQTIEGLIVSVAVSATHVAYSSIRMEPTWMALGHAAGLAAHKAIEAGVALRDVDIDSLQASLAAEGQVLACANFSGGSQAEKSAGFNVSTEATF
ncbi:FAD-dependent oxidoreductase [Blastopirellula retiformator]|uniref:Soluble pyridine nucleotide transhydrogenase n=1 Tax=Blastopirellula retiformator TaxID=2527970 RepID=A0A5C5V7X7_9BACT|nr:FAD-dependent oxidoreductase [Blastopirellula retiformator]TWT34664.1 soluble pyridine nucleotide transhydrogenase [Blastopirellula retiformator]